MTRQPYFTPLAASSPRAIERAVGRVLAAIALGALGKTAPTAIVNRAWRGDLLVGEYFDPEIRSASAPASTSGWGSQVLPTITGAFLSGLAPEAAAVKLFARALKLDLSGVYQINVPRASTSAAPVFVAEGAPMPIAQDTFASATLGPTRKMLLGMALTAELEQLSAESALAIIEKAMREQAGKSLDAAVFSAAAADSTRPAGLLFGAVPIAPSAGGGLSALAGDLRNIAGAISDAGGNPDTIFFVASPELAVSLRLLASPSFNYEIASTNALAAGTIVGIAADGIASAYGDGLPEIDVSQEFVAHFEDASPAAIAIPGSPNTISAPVRSGWQQNLLGLRLRLRCAWGSLAPGMVQVVNNATW